MDPGYLQYTFNTTGESLKEILIAELSAIGFNGFEERDEELLAFISSPFPDEDVLKSISIQYGVQFDKKFIEAQNWNSVWESNFNPVIIDNKVAIRAGFHPPVKNVLHEIIITPKMSFGTGHHATTFMMIEQMCRLDFQNKSVFDFGTGTGILAILAEKLGASSIMAIDNDDRSIENAMENIDQNNCSKIEIVLNDKPPPEKEYNLVLANINRNIITENLSRLTELMLPGAHLLISGLLEKDEHSVLEVALAAELSLLTKQGRQGWILLHLTKK